MLYLLNAICKLLNRSCSTLSEYFFFSAKL